MHNELRGSFQYMKALNRSIILNQIRQEEPISRAELAKKTSLTPPTVSNIVKELIESGFVLESKQGQSSGGRKPTMLVINSKNFYVIGLDVGPKYLRVVLTDLNGTVMNSFKKLIPSSLSNEDLLTFLIQAIREVMDHYKNELSKIIGIGIGMHGIVDVDQGLSLYAPTLRLQNVPIKSSLEKEFTIPVKVENDARVLALGESWFYNDTGHKNMITINVGRGIGAGIVINGNPFYGNNFIAGEVGHMIIDSDGIQCSCGNYGCLQTLATGPAMANKAIKEISNGRSSLLQKMTLNNSHNITGKLIYEAAIKGDELSKEVLKGAGIALGIGLTNIIHILNPERIVIGGGVSNAGDFVLGSVKETIAKRALTMAAKKTDIVISKSGEYGTAVGAVALIINENFSSDTLHFDTMNM